MCSEFHGAPNLVGSSGCYQFPRTSFRSLVIVALCPATTTGCCGRDPPTLINKSERSLSAGIQRALRSITVCSPGYIWLAASELERSGLLIPVSPGCHAYFPARLTGERAFSTCYVCSHPGVSATIVPASITTSLCWGCGWRVFNAYAPLIRR